MKKIFTLIAFLAVSLCSMAQSQYFYEWKDGKYIQRSVSEIDSITFSLADAPETEYKYVDLGLPSGTLWADRNVGADSPEAYGDYFAWGETSTKSTYDWDTYKWCQSSNTTLTKYCTNSSYGTIDNKTVLDLEDDAAYVNMGLKWRMPTIDELNELNTECTWTWTTQNGTNGYKVTGPNGNSIFLPAAGYRDDSELYVVGSGGVYWSSTLYESNPVSAQYLGFSLSSHSMYGNSRNYGLTVRAVNSTATWATWATCKEVGEAPDGKYFVVSGTITKIVNTTYGNWYMTDGTAELYIYGTLDAEGKTKNFLSLGLEVGDKVTIEGPKSSYQGDPQMVDVTVKKIEKALLKIVTPSVEISKEGGVLEVKLASKGKGAFYEISEECQEWISYENAEYISGKATKLEPNPADTVVYTFNIAPNNAGAREGSIIFRSNDGAPIPYTFTQAGGIADVTVAEFFAAEFNETTQYRIVGHVTGFNKYNNNFYLKDYTGEVYAYYVNTQGVENIAIGDFVTVVGTRSEYKGTPQLPKGTLLEKHTASPEVTVAEFLTKEDSKDVYYKLTGTITEIKNAQYGNVYIQDANGDIVYVYGLLPGYGATGAAKQGLVEAKGLKVGDTITIVGNKASYNGAHQVGNAVYMSHVSN